jgi:hypothetical protein
MVRFAPQTSISKHNGFALMHDTLRAVSMVETLVVSMPWDLVPRNYLFQCYNFFLLSN